MEEDKKLYQLNDLLLFRICTLAEGEKLDPGDCTNSIKREHNFETYYSCNQDGIHFHCAKHPEMELDSNNDYGTFTLTCPKCQKCLYNGNKADLISKCKRILNEPKFKNAKLIRIEDWYFLQTSIDVKFEKPDNPYWIHADVKEEKTGDSMVVLYVGRKDSTEKCQFFIKPEKLQLTNDYKDLDPAKILAKIEVTFKNKTITEKFD